MTSLTPPIQRLRAEVFDRFPRAIDLGAFVCRKINPARNVWSQHAWGNALDIGVPLVDHGPRRGWDGRDRTDTDLPGYDVTLGDEIAAWVRTHRGRLGTGRMIWRAPLHWDHLHVEGAHTFGGTPPCAGGPPITYPTTEEETMRLMEATRPLVRELIAEGHIRGAGTPAEIEAYWTAERPPEELLHLVIAVLASVSKRPRAVTLPTRAEVVLDWKG